MVNDRHRGGRDGSPASADALERELLARLGLGVDATPEQLDATHEAVVTFLTRAPRSLRGWARAEAAAADEAYALLADPAALARAASHRAGIAPDTTSSPPRAPEAQIQRPAVRPRRHEPEPREPALSDDELDDLIAAVTPSAHRDEVRHDDDGLAAEGARPRPRRAVLASVPFGRAALGVAALAAAVVIGVVVYNAGSPEPIAASAPSASVSPAPSLDTAQVAALMTKIKANPNDADALMGLGDAFFQAGQYDVAASWLTKLVALDGKNERALLALGAAEFNAGNVTAAEESWKRVVALDAKNVEAHYDLGFLYLHRQPSDLEGVRREWQLVVDLAPGTEVARSVQAQIDAIASANPLPSVSAVPSASPAGGPSVSPLPTQSPVATQP